MPDKLSYEAAMHGVQTGIAYQLERAPEEAGATPKHLRVGINSAMVNDAALAALLIRKGVITEDEYTAAIVDAANDELARYERWFRDRGLPVTLR